MSLIGGIDHTVVMAESLEEAALTANRLGFRTTPPAAHPFGTANVLIQLQGSYLELLAILDESLFPEEAANRFSFASFNRDFLIGEGSGISLIALKTDDPDALQRQWADAGLSHYGTFSFERTATAPDGRELPVSFTLAFASHAEFVRAGVFALIHHHPPENFWHPAYQAHPNTATRLMAVTMVAPHPERTAGVMARLAGTDAKAAGDASEIALAETSTIEVMDAAAFEARFASSAFADKAFPRFAAMTVAVADLEAAETALRAGGVPCTAADGMLSVAPEDAGGVGYRFVPEPSVG